jgi:hypothetical protein
LKTTSSELAMSRSDANPPSSAGLVSSSRFAAICDELEKPVPHPFPRILRKWVGKHEPQNTISRSQIEMPRIVKGITVHLCISF